ncbi:Hint domain-containing protein [Roseovarius litorisediminis]|uniref:Hint domain-containing protein n=1 Tax=Roseovarius litorisediminis TaxID=1312363 RepID=UPI0015944662|nr:Hint domain-containing protein [Roseovarius litorisediminis]
MFTTLTTTRPVAAPAIGTLVLASGQFLSNLSNMGWVVTDRFVTADLTVSVRTQSGAFTQLSTPSVPYNGLVSGLRFSWTNNPLGGGFSVLGVISNGLVCFHEGTQIETENGPVAIETLTPGTRLRTSDGALTTLKWLGCQQVDAILTHPTKTYPVRISAGALGNGLPQQDLLVSAEHALEIDGYLINAGALINCTTITQDLRKRADSYTYYHIDTGTHELILAEGIASETYIDYAAREAFDNADKAKATTIAEMPLPRISSARLVPAHIRNRLAPRIAAE